MRIDTVFFDVGHTLLTPALPEGRVFAEEAARHGVDLDPNKVQAFIPQMYVLYEELYEQDNSFWSDDQRAIAIWIEMYEYLCELTGVDQSKRSVIAHSVHKRYFTSESWCAYDDVAPALIELKARGVRMGLISNWDSSLEDIIIDLGFAQYFDVIISSAVAQLHKPMPEIFELALTRIGSSAAQSMHVGDNVSADVEGAHAVGITPVLIARSKSATDTFPPQVAPPGTLVISKLTELLSFEHLRAEPQKPF